VSRIIALSAPLRTGFIGGWYELASEDHFWMQWRLRAFLRQVDALGYPRGEARTGLDIGCGAGVVARQLERETSWVVDGADVDEAALALHGPARGRTLLYDIADRRPELREAYDFLILFDVLEHIDDPRRYLADALAHLKPGGRLFVNVPALELLRSAYDEVVGHRRRYDRVSLRRELEDAGLEVLDLRYWGLSMIPALWARALILSAKTAPADALRTGFRPPNAVVHALLRAAMRVETALISRPFAGTSLLAAALKPAAGLSQPRAK